MGLRRVGLLEVSSLKIPLNEMVKYCANEMPI